MPSYVALEQSSSPANDHVPWPWSPSSPAVPPVMTHDPPSVPSGAMSTVMVITIVPDDDPSTDLVKFEGRP
jgi:hypothetical protein